jgi:hypothetical protein
MVSSIGNFVRFGVLTLLGLVCAMTTSLYAASASDQPAIGHMEAIIENSDEAPYPEEMVLVRIRSTLLGTQIALELIEQPALQNFSWMQLGQDRWYGCDVEGAPAKCFERVLALFPIRSGQLTIDSFIHHLTVVGADGARRQLDLRSAPVSLAVRPWTAARGGPDARDSWWLPVKSLTVTDKWEPEPGRIRPGETAHRTVVVEALGIGAERLPPAPKLRSPGLITFAGPVERTTTQTPAGPIARAVYRWDVRPVATSPATLEAVHIPWFDTVSRRMRDGVLPARQVAFFSDQEGAATKHPLLERFILPLSLLVSFITGSAIVFVGPRSQGQGHTSHLLERFKARRNLKELRRAARSGDPSALRLRIYSLARRDPQRARRWLFEPSVRSGMSALDRYLFATAGVEPPELNFLVKTITKAWRRAGHEEERSPSSSPPAPNSAGKNMRPGR